MPGNRNHQPMRFFTFILPFRKLNGLLKSSPLGVLYSVFRSVLNCPGFLSPEIVSWNRKRWKELLVSLAGKHWALETRNRQAGGVMGAGFSGDETEQMGVTESGVHTPTPDQGRAPASRFYLWCEYQKNWRFLYVQLCISQVVMYLYTLRTYNIIHTFCLLMFI